MSKPANPRNSDSDSRLDNAVESYLVSADSFSLDIDELVALIDYAIDIDALGKAWLLLSAAQRLYPDHELIKPRMSYLLYQNGEPDLSKKVIGTINDRGLWSSFLNVLNDPKADNREFVARTLRDTVASCRRIEPDAVVNILAMARLVDCDDVLKELQDDIYSKAEMPTEFLLDLVDLANEHRDYDWVEALLDKLEQTAPFSPDFWEEKALFLLEQAGDTEEALSAVEYSLAVEPDSEQGLTIKARILAAKCREALEASIAPFSDIDAFDRALAEYIAEYIKVFNHIVELYPESCFEAMADLVSLYIALAPHGEDGPCSKLPVDSFLRYRKAHPADRRCVDLALSFFNSTSKPGRATEALDGYYTASDDREESEWVAMKQWAVEAGLDRTAKLVLESFYRMSGRNLETAECRTDYLTMLYENGRYREILAESGINDVTDSPGKTKDLNGQFIKGAGQADQIEDEDEDDELPDPVRLQSFKPVDFYILALAAIRAGRSDQVTVLAGILHFLPLIPGAMAVNTIEEKLVYEQVRDMVDKLASVGHRKRVTRDAIDKLDLFSSRAD